jgi:dihydroorotate dehydrogenase (NAD+) catalytic subunit
MDAQMNLSYLQAETWDRALAGPEFQVAPVAGMPDLSCEIAGVRLRNPLVLASGILGTAASLLERCARAGAGAVTAKSCGPTPRKGHANPTVIDWGQGLLNAVGLPNPGVDAEVAVLASARARLASLDTRLIASIFADTVANFGHVAATICQAQPDLLEVNISCPNVAHDFGLPFAASARDAAAVTEAVKRMATCPVIVKLAPNVPDIASIARAVVAAGADAICAVNTMPGMAIDVYSGQPILANRSGGISGPALKPIAIRAVYEITNAVSVPVIGTGGVTSGLDAAEMIMAGATAVGVGTAVYYRGDAVFGQLHDELSDFMCDQGYRSLAGMRGLAHA